VLVNCPEAHTAGIETVRGIPLILAAAQGSPGALQAPLRLRGH
jgi:hypothetical protein